MGLYYVIIAIILLACVLMVLVVLVQNSKGGGLASNLQGQNQYMGVRKTADFLEKTTWTLAIAIAVLSLASVFIIPHRSAVVDSVDTELRESIEKGKQESFPVIDLEKQKEAMQQQESAQPQEQPKNTTPEE